jgi:hypothetical protein
MPRILKLPARITEHSPAIDTTMPVQVQQVETLAPLVGEQLRPWIYLIEPDEPHRSHRRRIITEPKRMQRIIIGIEIYRLQLGTPQRSLNTRQAHALHLGDSPQAVAFGPQPGHLLVPVMLQAQAHSTMFAYPTARPVYRHAVAVSSCNRYSQQTRLKSPNPSGEAKFRIGLSLPKHRV